MKKTAVGIGIVVCVTGLALFLSLHRPETGNEVAEVGREPSVSRQDAPVRQPSAAKADRRMTESAAADNGDLAEEPEKPLTAEEKAEAEAEAKVDAFDALTDKWMEPTKAGVSMKDVADFVAAFRAVPKDRKDECIHRALNLVPDENVMLLAGVLTDKSEDKEIVEEVFSDILNRDEDVKRPILKQIFADKTHPCWADTAWILDVTGDLPAKK